MFNINMTPTVLCINIKQQQNILLKVLILKIFFDFICIYM